MEGGLITMSATEQGRLVVMARVREGKVQVQEHMDDSLHLVYRDREVLFEEIDKLPEKRQKISEKPTAPAPKKKPVPSLDHPWRHMSFRSLKRKAAWNYG